MKILIIVLYEIFFFFFFFFFSNNCCDNKSNHLMDQEHRMRIQKLSLLISLIQKYMLPHSGLLNISSLTTH